MAFSSSALSGAAVWERLRMNLDRYAVMPRKRSKASLFVRGVMSLIACDPALIHLLLRHVPGK